MRLIILLFVFFAQLGLMGQINISSITPSTYSCQVVIGSNVIGGNYMTSVQTADSLAAANQIAFATNFQSVTGLDTLAVCREYESTSWVSIQINNVVKTFKIDWSVATGFWVATKIKNPYRQFVWQQMDTITMTSFKIVGQTVFADTVSYTFLFNGSFPQQRSLRNFILTDSAGSIVSTTDSLSALVSPYERKLKFAVNDSLKKGNTYFVMYSFDDSLPSTLTNGYMADLFLNTDNLYLNAINQVPHTCHYTQQLFAAENGCEDFAKCKGDITKGTIEVYTYDSFGFNIYKVKGFSLDSCEVIYLKRSNNLQALLIGGGQVVDSLVGSSADNTLAYGMNFKTEGKFVVENDRSDSVFYFIVISRLGNNLFKSDTFSMKMNRYPANGFAVDPEMQTNRFNSVLTEDEQVCSDSIARVKQKLFGFGTLVSSLVTVTTGTTQGPDSLHIRYGGVDYFSHKDTSNGKSVYQIVISVNATITDSFELVVEVFMPTSGMNYFYSIIEPYMALDSSGNYLPTNVVFGTPECHSFQYPFTGFHEWIPCGAFALEPDSLGNNIAITKSYFDWNVYPNPTSGQITVQFETELEDWTKIKITNLLGQIISEKKLLSGSYSFDISMLPAGTYFIEAITSDSQMFSNRIIKE